jgi:hypothetical protein
MGHVAQILSTVILSGERSLLDHEVFRSFTNNLFALNRKILELSSNDKSLPVQNTVKPLRSVEFDCDKSSLTNSEHNSDVTNDNGVAQEQSSCLWVSEFAGSSSDDEVHNNDSNVLKYRSQQRKQKPISDEGQEEQSCIGVSEVAGSFSSDDEISDYLKISSQQRKRKSRIDDRSTITEKMQKWQRKRKPVSDECQEHLLCLQDSEFTGSTTSDDEISNDSNVLKNSSKQRIMGKMQEYNDSIVATEGNFHNKIDHMTVFPSMEEISTYVSQYSKVTSFPNVAVADIGESKK